MRFADSLNGPEVYSLAGLIARKIADKTRSRELLLNAASLRSDVAAKALAYQAAEDGDWEGACRCFFQHTELRPSLSPQDHDTLIAFGRALTHLPSREMPGLASIIDKCSDSDTKNLAQILLAFTLAPGSDQAASLVLSGNIAQARLVSPTSPVFETPPDLPPSTDESTSLVSGSPKTRTGKVSANYKWGGYGFLTDGTSLPRRSTSGSQMSKSLASDPRLRPIRLVKESSLRHNHRPHRVTVATTSHCFFVNWTNSNRQRKTALLGTHEWPLFPGALQHTPRRNELSNPASFQRLNSIFGKKSNSRAQAGRVPLKICPCCSTG